jgi:hypothetical protein
MFIKNESFVSRSRLARRNGRKIEAIDQKPIESKTSLGQAFFGEKVDGNLRHLN